MSDAAPTTEPAEGLTGAAGPAETTSPDQGLSPTPPDGGDGEVNDAGQPDGDAGHPIVTDPGQEPDVGNAVDGSDPAVEAAPVVVPPGGPLPSTGDILGERRGETEPDPALNYPDAEPVEEESIDEPYVHPDPMPVGFAEVHDNVTVPGVQTTITRDATSDHGEPIVTDEDVVEVSEVDDVDDEGEQVTTTV